MLDSIAPCYLQSDTFLVGAGVVGRAILQAHIDRSMSVVIVDTDQTAVETAVDQMQLQTDSWTVSPVFTLGSGLPAMELISQSGCSKRGTPIVIESVAERLEIKQAFFANAESVFGDQAVFCSNTSTLRIQNIASALRLPDRLCGMHFFMPVSQRSAVEIVRSSSTSDVTIDLVCDHARRLSKDPLVVADAPGFIVNRLLSPYLNESMLLLGRGISAEQIEAAALAYGMPLSPLELIDWIGTRTVFDAGRAFWQAFPDRISPSPIGPALLKRRRFGRSSGGGFYDYDQGVRSASLSAEVAALTKSYIRDPVDLSDQEVMELLSIPMWIEAALACQAGVVINADQLEIAMKGGLGFDPTQSWIGFFEALSSESIMRTADRWSNRSASLTLPSWIAKLLGEFSPSQVIEQCGR